MTKILTILGARPQFIKSSPVSNALAEYPEMSEVIVHTGQHFDAEMSEIFFQQMEIQAPKYNLGIHSLTHGAMTGRMLEKIEKVIGQEHPDFVIVYGDTNSTLAGSLAAKKAHVKVAHVEAGLRSFNMQMPEEINRIMTDRISDILFCPTTKAVQNLQKEGFDDFDCQVVQCGDVMYDSVLHFAQKADHQIIKERELDNFILCTIHRAENTDNEQRLMSIVKALNELHKKEMEVVIPMHPRTKKVLDKMNLQLQTTVLEPVGYLDMLSLLQHSSLVITDSGGLQKEAFFFEKKCVTLRDETEWTELVDLGVNRLVDVEAANMEKSVRDFLSKKCSFNYQPYGKGDAAQRIAETLAKIDDEN